MLNEIISFIVETVSDLGYIGIFIMMTLESSFFPFPSEVVLIPAGYLVYKGEMNAYLVTFSSVLGSILGAFINYYLALYLGREFLLKFGKYFFFKKEHLKKVEDFFQKHGSISTFNGRLIPVIRQYISFPAGLAMMNKIKFCFYTSLGAFIWSIILMFLGYFLGKEEKLIKEYLSMTIYITLFIIGLISLLYIKKRTKKH